MFAQVISGNVHDVDGMRRAAERWDAELRPGAAGYLGATNGVTDDGRFVTVVRFESADAARHNSERPEQGEWWNELSKNVSDVVVHDCSRIETISGGGSDDATFVQVMQGRVKDPAKADELLAQIDEMAPVFQKVRPDVLGQVIAVHDDGTGYTDVVYFSSETEARANESKEMPAEMQEFMAQFDGALEVTDYLDLRRLWLR
jgi:hypothetical protein